MITVCIFVIIAKSVLLKLDLTKWEDNREFIFNACFAYAIIVKLNILEKVFSACSFSFGQQIFFVTHLLDNRQ